MPSLISVSHRTDIPTFYGAWFLHRMERGFVGWADPFNHCKHLVSLLPQGVTSFIFWSKNDAPFLDMLSPSSSAATISTSTSP